MLRIPIKIKRATEKEIQSIAMVASACFSGMKDLKSAKRWVRGNFLGFPRMQYFIAKNKKLVVGFILWMEKGGFRKESVIELEQIAVLPDCQGKGIGTKLIKESLKEVKKYLKERKSKLKLIEVTTGTTNEAQRLYKKTLGAEVETIVKDLFRGDEVIMFSRFDLKEK